MESLVTKENQNSKDIFELENRDEKEKQPVSKQNKNTELTAEEKVLVDLISKAIIDKTFEKEKDYR